ncbi:MAG TPA: type II secretion system F family protein [Verrucomicrobiae bacterium]|jgi:type II secretory pathway component PulF|nr:type II secretion system F family protein [Verrucomicrobiae bacterium]
MKFDEFAFLNQQLAAMLKSGIPLETSLRQVCAGMRRQRWRKEFERLESDLSQGVPLDQALDGRKLPDLYKQMVKVGAKTNNLPALLTLVADHYQKNGFLWTRLKGLMVYPVIVLIAALALSLLLAVQGQRIAISVSEPYYPYGQDLWRLDPYLKAGSMMPACVLGALTLMVLLLLILPSWRAAARWVLPGFKDAHLARLASSLNLLLASGADLGGALGLMRRLESGNRIARDLSQWEVKLSSGVARVSAENLKTRAIPPLFFWLLNSEGEDMTAGFARAAEIFYRRAMYKTDLLLNAALPVSILALGLIIVIQLFSTVQLILKAPLNLFDFY